MVTQPKAPPSRRETTIIGARGTQTRRPFCSPHQCWLGGHEVVHELLYLPDFPVPLMGRDQLAKMGAQISFSANGSAQLKLTEPPSPLTTALAVRREEEWHLHPSPPEEGTIPLELETEYPLVWAKGNPPGLAKCHTPILIDLNPGAQLVKLWQYMTPREA